MIRQIAPQFFTKDIPGTLAYYKDKLGFASQGTWQDPPTYAIVTRDQHGIHFRCAEPPAFHADKYAEELLDAYLFVEDADVLHAEYQSRRRVHPGTWHHALALPGVCSEGLRWPSAGLRLKPI